MILSLWLCTGYKYWSRVSFGAELSQLKVKAKTAADKFVILKGPRYPHQSNHLCYSGPLKISASLVLGRRRKEKGDLERLKLTAKHANEVQELFP